MVAKGAVAGTVAAKTGTVATKAGALAAKTGSAALGSKIGTAATLLVVGGASVFAAYNHSALTSDDKPEAMAVQAASPDPVVKQALPEQAPSAQAQSGAPPTEPAVAEPQPSSDAPAARKALGPSKPEANAELSVLQRARAALASDPARALRLSSGHARDYPNSQFAQEREVIRIEALRKLGREDEARKRGRDFSERFPDSAHGSRLDQESQ
jgi:hypothetical protein